MNETVCDAYTSGNVNFLPSMEDILYDSENSIYNSDAQLDSFIYCVALRCGDGYCSGIGL